MANPTPTGLNVSGIYKITSKVHPERVYIGSAVNFKKRWDVHKRDFRKNVHHSPQFQYHYNKYGLEDLDFSIVAICNREELKSQNGIIWIEQCFILAYHYKEDNKPYFNACPTAGSCLGRVFSTETRKKQSGVAKRGFELGRQHPMKGKHHKQETKDKLRDVNLGKKLLKETTDKMSKIRKGKKMPEGFGEKVSKWMMGNKNAEGHVHSVETCEILRQKQTGRVYSLESREKMSDSHKEQKSTEEQRIRQSIAVKEWWRKRKENEFNNKVA